MDQVRAGLASCVLQLKLRFSPIRLGLNLIESVPVTITYAWLAIQSNNSDLLTHILVGAVFGVGLARGIGALDMRVVGSILISWVATLPIAAVLSVFFFYLFQALLGT